MPATTTVNELNEVPNSTKPETEAVAVIRSKWVARGIGAIVLVSAAVAGTMLWLDSRHFESTDDAEVDGHFAALSTRIEGTVVWVNPNAENDHSVKAGDLLLKLDPRDFQVALERAKANLKVRQSEARGAGLEVPITDTAAFSQLHAAEAAHQEAVEAVQTAEADLAGARHRLEQDRAIAGRAERDRVRYEALVEKREFRDPHMILAKRNQLQPPRPSKQISRRSRPVKERSPNPAAWWNNARPRSRAHARLPNSY